MTESTLPEHTFAVLREIRDEQKRRFDAIDSSLGQVHTDMASMQKSHGAIMSMIGGQHDRMNEFTRRLERLEKLMEQTSDA